MEFRSVREIQEMLRKFNEVIGEEDDSSEYDDDFNAAHDVLLWVCDASVSNERVTDYIPVD
jgi:hypothetical protein